jgi:hypothetical protein
MHMRIQGYEDNPSKANYKLWCIYVYSRGCTSWVQFTKRSTTIVSTRWPLDSDRKGMGWPHSSEDKKWCPWHKSCFTGICGAQYIGYYMPVSSRDSLLLIEEIWKSTVISQTFQFHLLVCLPRFPYDRSLSIVATTYIWHSSNFRSGKHVKQNTVPIPEPFIPPRASLLPRYHQQHSHWIIAICCRKWLGNSILHNVNASNIFYYEYLSLSLKEKHGLRVFGNRVPKGIFGSKGQ